MALWRPPALAIPRTFEPATLSGTEFDLSISEVPVNIAGQTRNATLINGGLPGPTLRWREGDVVTLRVRNELQVPTSILARHPAAVDHGRRPGAQLPRHRPG